VGLRERRAAIAPALAFGMGAPSLNVATIVFIGVALGWRLAALRVVLALVGVVGVSLLAARVAGSKAGEVPVQMHSEPEAAVAQRTGVVGWLRRWVAACFRLGIVLAPIYVVVVLLLGVARAWLFPLIGISGWGNGLIPLALLALAGTLFVIPTAGEVPIVQALLAAGLAIGPAAALLITLPIVSLPSLAMLRTAMPTRVLVTVFGSIWLLGIVGGLFAAGFL